MESLWGSRGRREENGGRWYKRAVSLLQALELGKVEDNFKWVPDFSSWIGARISRD